MQVSVFCRVVSCLVGPVESDVTELCLALPGRLALTARVRGPWLLPVWRKETRSVEK